ncbi:cd7 antigen-like [Cyprinodon tularosa]|uniref:cd7 antigen-like n=1 Tax=Cyprinodon tularosa TaxID=77115 RepID=UPI0018E20078|nr:cd7 antigen-like [Cyprinodon tularosa]
MKTHLRFILLFIQVCEVFAEVVFKRLAEDQCLVLSSTIQPEHGRLVGLYLYHRGPQGQTTLLSAAEGTPVRVDPERGARLQLSGGLNSLRINISISPLQLRDSGLYMWELRYVQKNGSEQVILWGQKCFLLVEREGGSCQCSHGYIPLLLTISAAAGLLLLTTCLLVMEKCVRVQHRRPLQPNSPIYEEMSRKQKDAGSPNVEHKAPPRSEGNFPIYANPNIRQPQDNYYASPRQLALRA